MISWICFWYWLDAVKQEAIAWADDDSELCYHMASLGHNILNLHPETLTKIHM